MAEEKDQQQQQLAMWGEKLNASVAGGFTAEQVWPLLADFVGIHRLIPTIQTCRLEQGVAGELGCIRFCSGGTVESADGEGVAWAIERLTNIDHDGHKLTYELLENNIGWSGYQATMEVVDEEGSDGGCRIEWSFKMQAVEGGSQDGVAAYLQATLEAMVNRIQRLLLHGHETQDN